ncbi:MAG: hypothetical protein EOO65_01805 [Methanosarcinales archaeon]|nr:MAG: hypothetical protein EOO65_01805 [Methanosarcinales archaeon]
MRCLARAASSPPPLQPAQNVADGEARKQAVGTFAYSVVHWNRQRGSRCVAQHGGIIFVGTDIHPCTRTQGMRMRTRQSALLLSHRVKGGCLAPQCVEGNGRGNPFAFADFLYSSKV